VTSPPQPQRHIHEDLSITGISSGPGPNPKRQAANQRQREAAAAEEAYQRWRQAMVEQNYGPQ
jgi:hypothetical protein